ncbi:uncharacterized protein RJT21DRAFT_53102 [Scheffersomyces amazonensis]|uniref:uncharacterized protein n=1 Tax=Scheffersomyces amazonensis TaxID=1078765 RepID=UPI00315DC735
MINSTNTSPSRSNDTNSTSPSNNNNININNNKIGSSTSSPFKAPPGFIRNDVNSSPASFSSPQNTPKTLPSTNNSSPHLQNNNSAHNSQRSNSISTVLSNNSVPPISPRNSIVNNHLHDLRSGSTSSSNCVSTSPITSNYNYSYTTVNSNAVQRSPTFNHRNLSTGTPPLPITTVNTNNSMKRYSYSSGSAGGDNNPNSNSNANANANVNSSSVSGSSSSPQQYNSEQIFDLMEREQDAIVLKLMNDDDTMDASNEGTTKDTKKYKYTDYDKIIEENNSLKREIQTLKVKLEELERR